ncbi:inner membrane-spanning protein YciB [Terricaulis sp.]|uniref:inner membrane-spanning protein YciB n=1 Tax=Terricaulis sp. TaxID=2768686 RepID=UPI003783E5BD
MTETNPAKKTGALSGASQLAVDLGPIAVFIVSYNILHRIEATKENAIYLAIGLFIAATLAAIAYCKIVRGKIPPVLLVTGALVTVFGVITILLRDPSIIQIKFTITFLFYAAAIAFSLLIKQNVWKLLFRHAFSLPDKIWDILAWRWAAFYVLVAVFNEVLRHYYNEANGNFDVWLNVRTALTYPAFLLFAAANTPLVLKHHIDDEADGAGKDAETPSPSSGPS